MKKTSFLRTIILVTLICTLLSCNDTQNNKALVVKNTQEKLNSGALKEWQQMKFGLFIHWGIYSVLGDGEWVMNKQNISISDKLKSFL